MAVAAEAVASPDVAYDARVEALASRLASVPANRDLALRLAEPSAEGERASRPSDLRARLAAQRLVMLRVPGLLHASHPETGADLARLEDWLELTIPLIPVGEKDTVERNAEQVARYLREVLASDRRALLVSASKGSADVRTALEADPSLGARVAAWIDLVGVLEGTPLTDPGGAGASAAHAWLPAETARSLSRRVRARAAAPGRFPARTRAVHVAAFPRAAEVSPAARAGFEALRGLGPNDGYVLLDALERAPGRVLVVRGADHYLVARDLRRELRALVALLLDEIEQEDTPAPQPPP